jgi:hypothetical protein
MRLNDAMSGVVKVGYKQGIYSSINSAHIYANAEDNADAIYTVNAGVKLTVTETVGHYGFTKHLGYYGWVDLDHFDITSGGEDKTVTVNAPEVAYKGDGVTVSWSAEGAAAYTYKIIDLIDKRQGPKLVPLYAENLTPQEELDKLTIPRETVFVFRERGTGRPTKKERREIDALMDGFYYDEEDDE